MRMSQRRSKSPMQALLTFCSQAVLSFFALGSMRSREKEGRRCRLTWSGSGAFFVQSLVGGKQRL